MSRQAAATYNYRRRRSSRLPLFHDAVEGQRTSDSTRRYVPGPRCFLGRALRANGPDESLDGDGRFRLDGLTERPRGIDEHRSRSTKGPPDGRATRFVEIDVTEALFQDVTKGVLAIDEVNECCFAVLLCHLKEDGAAVRPKCPSRQRVILADDVPCERDGLANAHGWKPLCDERRRDTNLHQVTKAQANTVIEDDLRSPQRLVMPAIGVMTAQPSGNLARRDLKQKPSLAQRVETHANQALVHLGRRSSAGDQ